MTSAEDATGNTVAFFQQLNMSPSATGVTISSRHVLTAGHVIYQKSVSETALNLTFHDGNGSVITGQSNLSFVRPYPTTGAHPEDLALATFAAVGGSAA